LKRRLQTKALSPDAVGIVVRRGARRRFDALKQKTADLDAVVSWDRRQTDRRASSQPAQIDQRKTERRRKPPFTWEVADFVVLDHSAPEAAPPLRIVKGAKPQTAKGKRQGRLSH
jgi:hypothetical protein